MIALDLSSHVEKSCEITRISLLVDGDIQYWSTRPGVPAFDADPRQVARVSLRPGTHTLGVLASAACRGGDLGDDPIVLTLRDSRSFLVGEGPATLVIDLRTGELDERGERHLDAAVAIRGGELGPALGPGGPLELDGSVDGAGVDARHCKAMELAPRAVCHGEAVLARARAQKDIVRVLCIQEKLTQIRACAAIIERARQRTAETPSAGSAPTTSMGEDTRIIEMAEDRIQALALEAELCRGEDIMKTESVEAGNLRAWRGTLSGE